MAPSLGSLGYYDVRSALRHKYRLLDAGDHRGYQHALGVRLFDEVSGLPERDAEHRHPLFEDNLELLGEGRGRQRKIRLS